MQSIEVCCLASPCVAVFAPDTLAQPAAAAAAALGAKGLAMDWSFVCCIASSIRLAVALVVLVAYRHSQLGDGVYLCVGSVARCSSRQGKPWYSSAAVALPPLV